MPKIFVDFDEFGQRVTLCLNSGKFYGHKIDYDYSRDNCSYLGCKNTENIKRPSLFLQCLAKCRTLYAILINVAVRIVLFFSFHFAYQLVCYSKAFKVENDISLDSALEIFIKAEQILPSSKINRDCLPRSISLYIFLKSYGFDVTHKIGVSIHPFCSHAWVEINDRLVLEQSNFINSFKIISTI